MKTYDEPVSFCHRCCLFNDEVKNIKRNNIMDATISTSVFSYSTSANAIGYMLLAYLPVAARI